MHDEHAFLQAMQEHPEDSALRLVFADWLEERGDERGTLLRLLHTLTQSVHVRRRRELENRLRNLLARGAQPVGPFVTNSVGMKFAWIPPGTFMMGSPAKGYQLDGARHQVTLSKGFYLGVHPVTQAVWREVFAKDRSRFPGKNPSHFQGADRPVEQVTWQDCEKFLRKLSWRDRHTYRLPSEAEWEYACRAGTTTAFYFGETIATDQANYNGDDTYGAGRKGASRGETTPVGIFPPNGWGLYDMHGNVREWCSDWHGDYPTEAVHDPQGPAGGTGRVSRGGSYRDAPTLLRSASRRWESWARRVPFQGFRVAMDSPKLGKKRVRRKP
jgi:uncharacterized protein (TIGR02996 family)